MFINYKLISDFIYWLVNIIVYIKIVVKKWFNINFIFKRLFSGLSFLICKI